jgi:hypothetical protein
MVAIEPPVRVSSIKKGLSNVNEKLVEIKDKFTEAKSVVLDHKPSNKENVEPIPTTPITSGNVTLSSIKEPLLDSTR